MSSEKLYIAATEETPEVCLTRQDGRSYISGRSLPENAHEFYSPVIQWVVSHSVSIDRPFEIEFRFDYFNSSSGRYLFEMLTEFEKNPKRSLVKIVWTVEEGDELMLEKGMELKSLLDLHFEIRVVA